MSKPVNNLNNANNSNITSTPAERNAVSLFDFFKQYNSKWSQIVIKRDKHYIRFRDDQKNYFVGFGATIEQAFEDLQSKVVFS